MKRIRKMMTLLLLIPLYGQITWGCIGGGGPGAGGGIGGAFNPGGNTIGGGGGIAPPDGTGGGGGPPPPGTGSASPNQPGQEGIGRLRPYYVLVNVLRPVGTSGSAMKMLNNGELGDLPQENALPEDPFPAEKPNVFLRTEKPDYTMPPEAADSQGRKLFYYFANYDKSVTPPVCITELNFYATYHEGNMDYRSDTATVVCPGTFEENQAPVINLQLVPYFNPASGTTAPEGSVFTQ